MKKLPLIFFLGAFSLNAQNKLTAEVKRSYSDPVTLNNIDSIYYSYQWDMGVINAHAPEFGIFNDAPVYLWQYNHPTLDYTTRDFWSGTSLPLTMNWSSTKTYNANGLCTMDAGSGYRELYTYTAAGKIETFTAEFEVSPGVWEVAEKRDYFYDVSNRLIAQHYFDGGSGFYTQKDSLWYDASTTNIVKNKHYESTDGVVFNIFNQADIYWTAGHPDYINYFEDDDSDPNTPIVWFLQGNYTFPGAWCTKFEAHLIVMGTPDPSVIAQWDYSYNGSGQLTSDLQTGAFGSQRLDYTYQADGLLETIDRQEDQGSGLFTVDFTQFYYTDVAGIEEQEIAFSVFPNPTTDVVTLTEKFDMIRVLDMNGQLMILQRNTDSIDLSQLANGTYVLQVSKGSGFGSETVVKR